MTEQTDKQKTEQETVQETVQETAPEGSQSPAHSHGAVRRTAIWLWERRDRFVVGCALAIILCHLPIPVPAKWMVK